MTAGSVVPPPSTGRPSDLPAWIPALVLPILNIAVALFIAGLIVIALGVNPWDALVVLISGAVGQADLIGLTLYYTTSFIFVGLAVAVAFHAGLFNIGGEGQAYIAGLGVGLTALMMPGMPWWTVAPVAIVMAMLTGGIWGMIPGILQAYRGSHIVITTIMFNFIAASIMNYLLVDVLIAPGQQSPESAVFDTTTWLPRVDQILASVGVNIRRSPLNLSFLWALIACAVIWVFIARTRWGYEIRTVGANERAALYAGIRRERVIVLAMFLSGGLAGFMALNEILGVQYRIVLGFTGGVGFVGIAVALMGRNHPFGILLSSLLFGILYQGGSELSLEYSVINRELVVVIQGLVIFLAGALENQFRPLLVWLWSLWRRLKRGGHRWKTH